MTTHKPTGHEWDADGERCLKCGDKDWLAGPTCSADVAVGVQACRPEGRAMLATPEGAEMAQLRKDAERYRWLRDSTRNTDALLALLDGVPMTVCGHNEFDAAIDAAMKSHNVEITGCRRQSGGL